MEEKRKKECLRERQEKWMKDEDVALKGAK